MEQQRLDRPKRAWRWKEVLLLCAPMLVLLCAFGVIAAKNRWLPAPRMELSRGRVLCLAFSPDGKTLATGSVSGRPRIHGIKLWDVQSKSLLRALAVTGAHPDGYLLSVAFSAEGKLIAGGGADGSITLWNAQTGAMLRSTTVNYMVGVVAFSPNGRYLATTGALYSGGIQIWDIKTGAPVRKLAPPTGGVSSVVFSADGKLMACVRWSPPLNSPKYHVSLWNAQNWQLLKTLNLDGDYYAAAFMPDKNTLAIGGSASTLLWNIQTGSQRLLPGCQAGAVSPDGKLAASVTDNGAKLWDMKTGSLLREWRIGPSKVQRGRQVEFSSDSQMLAGLHDGTVRLWDIDKLQ